MTTLASEAPERLPVLDTDSHLTTSTTCGQRGLGGLQGSDPPCREHRRRAHLGRRGAGGREGRQGQHDRQGRRRAPFQEWMVVWDEIAHTGAWDIDPPMRYSTSWEYNTRSSTPTLSGSGPGPGRREGPGTAKTSALRSRRLRLKMPSRATTAPAHADLPSWDIDACMREVRRIWTWVYEGWMWPRTPRCSVRRTWPTAPGTRSGRCARPGASGPLRIGSSLTAMNLFGEYLWGSQHHRQAAIGGTMSYRHRPSGDLHHLRRVFDRRPKLKMMWWRAGSAGCLAFSRPSTGS